MPPDQVDDINRLPSSLVSEESNDTIRSLCAKMRDIRSTSPDTGRQVLCRVTPGGIFYWPAIAFTAVADYSAQKKTGQSRGTSG